MQRHTDPEPKETSPSTPAPDEVDEASAESFPASDPPSWEPLHPGPPATPKRDETQPPRRADG